MPPMSQAAQKIYSNSNTELVNTNIIIVNCPCKHTVGTKGNMLIASICLGQLRTLARPRAAQLLVLPLPIPKCIQIQLRCLPQQLYMTSRTIPLAPHRRLNQQSTKIDLGPYVPLQLILSISVCKDNIFYFTLSNKLFLSSYMLVQDLELTNSLKCYSS